MGISNLLNFVKNASRPASIREFSGSTVAVDVSCWLHRGVFGCVLELALNKPTDFYIQYCMKYINMLLDHRCRVLLVFDGASLPSKKCTNETRRDRRESAKQKAMSLLDVGKTTEAVQVLQTATEITHDIVLSVIKYCRLLPNVDCLVAPYESDAQLAFLLQSNMVQLVVTEDSDLIVFGAERIMYKLDVSGNGILYERAQLPTCLPHGSKSYSFERFRRICILSGCDYLPEGLPGVGLSKASKFIAKTTETDLNKLLPRAPRYLKMPSLKITNDFIESVIRAEHTFLYQVVFDPTTRRRRHLNPLPENIQSVDIEYAGVLSPVAESQCLQLAMGLRHPNSFKIVDTLDGIKAAPPGSIWHDGYEPGTTALSSHHTPISTSKSVSAFQVTRHTRSPADLKSELNRAKAKLSKPSQSTSSPSSTWMDVDIARIYGINANDVKPNDDENDNDSLSENQSTPTVTAAKASSSSSPYFRSTAISSTACRNPFRVPRRSDETVSGTIDTTTPKSVLTVDDTSVKFIGSGSSPSTSSSSSSASDAPSSQDDIIEGTVASPSPPATEIVKPDVIQIDDIVPNTTNSHPPRRRIPGMFRHPSSSGAVASATPSNATPVPVSSENVKRQPPVDAQRQPMNTGSKPSGLTRKRPRISVDGTTPNKGRLTTGKYKCPLVTTGNNNNNNNNEETQPKLNVKTISALDKFAYRPAKRV